ncbi:MAG TPA: 2-oxopent-4-enoate hydratase [Caldilineaceae bacterium]|nr:2-oxopent-4-enoate hydratase [Caldilineaceae bacterium]
MLAQADRQLVAERLINAHRTHTPISSPKEMFPALEMEDAYRIQQLCIDQWVAEGARVKGYKVGLTSKAMQQASGISEPDFGLLLDRFFLPEAAALHHADFFGPLVEIEVAFVMKESLAGPHVNAADVIRATDFVLPSIELVDRRLRNRVGVVDTICDLASCGAVILGGNPMRLTDLDLRTVTGSVIKNGETLATGSAADVLGNPVNAVIWLANKLHDFGVTFEAGHVILTGSFVKLVPTAPGDHFVARFDQGFGDVELSFQ